MSDITATDMPPAPLVALTEDETLFRDTIRQFADETVTTARQGNGREGRLRALADHATSSNWD